MTQEQAYQITELRGKGLGYKAIANVIGLSRDVVRNYCKAHNLAGYGDATKKNIRLMMENGTVCKFCGKDIEQPSTGRKKKFCSEKCRRSWWKIHANELNRSSACTYHLKCSHCGENFISYGNKNRKYCCHNCYIKHRFWEDENGITQN